MKEIKSVATEKYEFEYEEASTLIALFGKIDKSANQHSLPRIRKTDLPIECFSPILLFSIENFAEEFKTAVTEKHDVK